MTRKAATLKAKAAATKKRSEMFVVWSREDADAPGKHFHVASEWDLDTFFSGCEVVAVVEPSGKEA